MANEPAGIWTKVNFDVQRANAQTEQVAAKETEAEKKARRHRRARLLRALDAVSTVFWVYLVLKVFFFDPERKILDAIAPDAGFLADYRFFVFLALIVVALVVLGKKRFLIALAYVTGFPLVVVVLVWPPEFGPVLVRVLPVHDHVGRGRTHHDDATQAHAGAGDPQAQGG